jgi:hypothetical protein
MRLAAESACFDLQAQYHALFATSLPPRGVKLELIRASHGRNQSNWSAADKRGANCLFYVH